MRKIIQMFVVTLLSTASVIAQVAKPAEPRTVSQVVDFWVTNTEDHANYAATLGEESPAGTDHETAPDSVKTMSQIIDYLKGSSMSLRRATVGINETNMNDPIPSKDNRTCLLMLFDAAATRPTTTVRLWCTCG